MTRMLRWSLLVVAVLAMFLTGCGDDDASDEPVVTGTTAPVDSTSTTIGLFATARRFENSTAVFRSRISVTFSLESVAIASL